MQSNAFLTIIMCWHDLSTIKCLFIDPLAGRAIIIRIMVGRWLLNSFA